MALTDILTIPFLISLGITLLLLSLVSLFFLQRFNEQNHKFSSMMGLVSTMAEELNFVRSRLQIPFSMQPHNQVYGGSNKIQVSDDEESDSDEDSDDDEEEEEDCGSECGDKSEKNIKIVNMSENFDINYENLNNIDEENNNELEDDAMDELEDLELGEDLEEDDTVEEDEKEIVTVSNDDLLKSINLNEDSLKKKDFEIQDYKKMSLSKLKETVVQKGLMADPSKLNKNKLLALLL